MSKPKPTHASGTPQRSGAIVSGDASCTCGHSPEDHGRDPVYPNSTKMNRFAEMIPPPGLDRMREQIYRSRYDRERRGAIVTDTGASWPVDIGEAGA